MGIATYLDKLNIADLGPAQLIVRQRGVSESTDIAEPTVPDPSTPAVVDGGSLLSFVAGISAQEMRDVLYSVQLAQRGASAYFNRFNQTREWYEKYSEILSQVGWVGELFAFKEYNQSSGDLQLDKAALEVIEAIATGQQLAILTRSLDALRKLSDGDEPITLLEYNALTQGSGNFQVGAVQKGPGVTGPLSMGLGGFYFRADKQKGRVLVFSWGSESTRFWAAAQKLTLNASLYDENREIVEKKLGAQAANYLSGLKLAA